MKNRMFRLIVFVVLVSQATVAAADDFFEKRVRPTLHEHCVKCHGPDQQHGGLRVDSREALLQGGDSGPAIVPGRADESLLLQAVRQEKEELKMPPQKAGPKLSDAVLTDLAAWLQAGAAWPPGDGPLAAEKENFNLEARKQRLPWIWQPPQRQTVPEVRGPETLDDVDRFVIAALGAKGLTPAPRTDDLTWLRRVHFAITGLPPRRQEMQAFLSDSTPKRRERVVEGLLASPHFGERWARHWMDLMRYAESRGHESDFSIANAWRYRDYLIRALNADLPYDRFVAEHVAGDLLPPRLDPTSGANESVLATGWAFLGEEVHSPVDIRQDECERVDNKIDVLSKTFLGLTVACARCHDHKFDALTQQDYYALSGFVLSSNFRQVRFETTEAHSRAARRLAEIRAKHSDNIRSAYAHSMDPGLATMVPYLLAARRVLCGEPLEAVATNAGLDPARLHFWLGQLKQAVDAAMNPLHLFAMLAHEPDVEDAERFGALLAKFRSPATPPLPSGAKVIADFTAPERTSWMSDGPAFGARPLVVGEVIFGTPDQPIARVLPYGAARVDSFWNRLALTPGTEMDSGNLGAAARAGRTLATPKSTLSTGQLHYLLRGKAQVYAGVDSHLMLIGPLHNGLVATFDTGGQLRWVTHDLSAYVGHRQHLEFSPQGDAGLEVLLVVESLVPPTWPGLTPWQPEQDVSSLRAVAESLRTDLVAAIESLGSGRSHIEPHLAPLADWLVQNVPLFASATGQVAAAGADYFREQDELSASIRWDSPTAVSWADGTGVDEQVLIRGKPTRPGAIAPRGLPEAFGLPRITPLESSGRAELARQLAEPANPLVARVMVNRIWHHLFGRGIVPTVDNFGYLGERPSHPELLDHLAWQFVHEDGWSLKRLIRQLVLCDTFAQSSRADTARAAEIDPENLLLHRMPVRRLEGEAIRDALLVISGRFDPQTFGPPVAVHLTEFIVGRGRPEVSGPLDGAGRRSVYLAARRNFLPTMMLAFDLPTPFSTVGRRTITNVPAQSLVMLNDPFVREQASVWAQRLLQELPNAEALARVVWLFETAYGRPPATEETQFSLASLAELRDLHPNEPEPIVWSEFCHALLNANDFIYLK